MDTLDRERADAPSETSAPPRRRLRWVLVAAVIAAVALFGIVLGLLVSDHVAQDQRFDQLHASVTVTRHHVSTQAADLADLRQAIASLKSQIASDTATWNQDTAELKAAYAAVVLTQADVSQQSTHINALQSCLGGVRQALNALAINDHASAVSSLDSVASSCTAAAGS